MERTYSTGEVANLLDVSYRRIDYLVRCGLVPGQPEHVGSGAPRRWTEADLEAARRVVEARRAARALLEGVGIPA